jgi:hypothetical protein
MKLSTVALLVAATGLFSFGGYALYSDVEALAPDTVPVTPMEPIAPVPVSPRLSPAADNPMPVARAAGDVTVDRMNGDIAALRQQIARLGADVSTLQRQARALEQAMIADRNGADLADRRPDDLIAREEAERQRQEELSAVETAFRQEPINARWRSETVTVIEEALTGTGEIQGTARAVECRSQTCRVELSGDRSTLTDFMPEFALRVGAILPGITADQIEHGDGTTTMILYLSRHADELLRNNG